MQELLEREAFVRDGARIHECSQALEVGRAYHLHGFRNRPHEYHNGGVWPIWLGWLGLALGRVRRAADLARLRTLVNASALAQDDFLFQEYLHGLTGAPAGTKSMAYSATGLVFLNVADASSTLALLAT